MCLVDDASAPLDGTQLLLIHHNHFVCGDEHIKLVYRRLFLALEEREQYRYVTDYV